MEPFLTPEKNKTYREMVLRRIVVRGVGKFTWKLRVRMPDPASHGANSYT